MKRPVRIPNMSDITDDTPLRLNVAAALSYPGGGMTASGLRKEHDAGRLTTEFTAGKEFTTLAEIKRMREACRGLRRGPASISSPPGRTLLGASPAVAFGSTSQDALRAILQQPSAPLPGGIRLRERKT